MKLQDIYSKVTCKENLSLDQAMMLYKQAPTAKLMEIAHQLREQATPHSEVVTWQIDRNVNITNVCISGCKFCNFHCRPADKDRAYITSLDEYKQKITQTLEAGGDQLLLQGGLHPKLDIVYYEELFGALKEFAPSLKLNALGAPEVAHIAKISSLSLEQTLERLKVAGLDTLPGAGAEILNEQVRKRISAAKPSAKVWLEVMRLAHRMNIPTTATMMYGHVETLEQRIEHLLTLRDLQAEKPEGHYGFTAFIPWIFHSRGTQLEKEGVRSNFSAIEYVRLIAMSRIILNNITNIQTSWLTVGVPTAQITLHGGANDMGSIMIEENVVSSAGASNSLNASTMQQAIKDAGFTPRLRNQLYEFRD